MANNVSVPVKEYARLVAADAHLSALIQCRYKPVEQLQAVLHSVAEAVDAQTKEGDNA